MTGMKFAPVQGGRALLAWLPLCGRSVACNSTSHAASLQPCDSDLVCHTHTIMTYLHVMRVGTRARRPGAERWNSRDIARQGAELRSRLHECDGRIWQVRHHIDRLRREHDG